MTGTPPQHPDLLLALSGPARLARGEGLVGDDPVEIEGEMAFGSWPPWPTPADLLVVMSSRALVGVCFLVAPAFRELVATLAHRFNPQLVRTNPLATVASQTAYQLEEGQEGWQALEVVWGATPPDARIPAGLQSVQWFFPAREPDLGQGIRILGLGIGGLDGILERFDLTWPGDPELPELPVRRLD